MSGGERTQDDGVEVAGRNRFLTNDPSDRSQQRKASAASSLGATEHARAHVSVRNLRFYVACSMLHSFPPSFLFLLPTFPFSLLFIFTIRNLPSLLHYQIFKKNFSPSPSLFHDFHAPKKKNRIFPHSSRSLPQLARSTRLESNLPCCRTHTQRVASGDVR